MNGWFIFNSRFSDVRADLRIMSAAHYGSDAATGADHGRSSQVNACVYTHRYVYQGEIVRRYLNYFLIN